MAAAARIFKLLFLIGTLVWVTTNSLGQALDGDDVSIGSQPPFSPRWAPITGTPNPLKSGNFTPSVQVAGATTSTTCKLMHVASSATRGLKLLVGSFYGVGTNGETRLDNPVTTKFSIELEDGSIHPATFDGAYTKVLTPTVNGCWAISDVVLDSRTGLPIQIGRGQRFWTRSTQIVDSPTDHVNGGVRALSATTTDNYLGMQEGCIAGDYAFSGYIPPSGETNAYGPIAVLGRGIHRSVAVMGDSIFAGTGEYGMRQNSGGPGYRAVTGQLGLSYDPSIVPTCGLLQLAKGGESIHEQIADATFKVRHDILLASGVTTILINSGTNDIGERSVAQIEQDIVTFVKTYADAHIRVIWCPLTPRTYSTDGWITVGGQSEASIPVDRMALRTWMLGGGFMQDCVAAGVNPYYVRVSDMPAAVACNPDGSPNRYGTFWRPDLGGGTPSLITQVASTVSLSDQSYRDAPHLGKNSGVAQNRYRGYTRVTVSSPDPNSINLWKASGIRYNYPGSGQCLGGPMPASYSLGDVVWIMRTLSDDGTHPSSVGANEMAKAFDVNLVLRG